MINYNLGNWIAVNAGPEEVDRWNKLVSDIEAEVTKVANRARNEALREAAAILQDQLPEAEAHYGPSDVMVLGMRDDVEAILALIKEDTPDDT